MKKYYKFKLNITTLNIFSFIILLIFILPLMIIMDKMTPMESLLSWILIIPYNFLHEIFHSISYVIHGAKFKNVTYGIHLEKGVLCCLCKQNINKANILFSLLYPFFFLGILTLVVGCAFDIKLLIFLSILNITGCSGDLLMFYHLLKIKDFEYTEGDDPTSFYLYTKEDLSKKRLRGLKNCGIVDNIERTIDKKIVVSKTSAIVFICILIIILLCII